MSTSKMDKEVLFSLHGKIYARMLTVEIIQYERGQTVEDSHEDKNFFISLPYFGLQFEKFELTS